MTDKALAPGAVVLASLLSACPAADTPSGPSPATGAAKVKRAAPMQTGWLKTLAEAPSSAQTALNSDCWSAFFSGDYPAALAAANADDAVDRLCRARVAFEVGALYASQAALLGTSQYRSLAARQRNTTAKAVDVEPFFAAAGRLWTAPGDADKALSPLTKGGLPQPYRALASALMRPCGKGTSVVNALRCRIEGKPWPDCKTMGKKLPAGLSSKLTPEWTTRLSAYRDARCAPGLDAVDAVAEWASRPAAERTVTDGATDIDATVEFHDPWALMVLADLYFVAAREAFLKDGELGLADLAARRLGMEAECRATGEDAMAALLFSRWQTYEDVAGECRAVGMPGAKTPERFEELRAYVEGWKATVDAAGSQEGRALVSEAGLIEWVGREAARSTAMRLSDADCVRALDLLQETRDPKQPDTIGPRNSPAFVARLTTRATCANRFSEARLILGRLAEMFPALAGTERAVVRLAVAEGMGPDDNEPKR